ncbi:hypothetical protein [Nostoc sp. CHAB 5715]|nr:hypothetical protein [Nostoc sp. CHAB 5715]
MIDADVYPLELTSIQLQTWLPHVAEYFGERAGARQQTFQLIPNYCEAA